MKILVTDDSRAMRMIVIRTLRHAGLAGHEMVEAEDGAQAMALVDSEKPDLILSDWNMPKVNGLEFLMALRAAGSTIPFFFVTSEGSEAMRLQAIEAGALGLIAKPFTAEQFTAILGTVMTA